MNGTRDYQLPEDVEEFLEIYKELLLEVLPSERIKGIYVYGSLALGAFDPNSSDLDFVTVINGRIGKKTEDLLNLVHLRCNAHQFGPRLDGCYITPGQVGMVYPDLEEYPFFTEGKMHRGFHDLNDLTWWMLKTKGITVYGEPFSVLPLEVRWTDAEKTMNEYLNTYWNEKVERDMCFFYDDWIEFGVVMLCRILLSFTYKNIFSKKEAIAKAKPLVPSLFHPILLEGLRIKTNPESESYYHSKAVRKEDMKRFVKYIITYCKETFQLQKV
ncbi:nucleotidyltransferase domain-containing protein [Fictibacillus nanhaiensis]|uniref:nucleotidyltransferase domain-containing protein n=1 Tax=Fictibacillus nanhaiensis TaxID=742169 RepID=UPI001C970484|nr:nucleotidyltransferase domain-containing protein [Fictibacillus nanhaiensis]MBY6037491.1 nucleotidyltransferase domain-containing protein [Fictibacillus nanhaiensis]